MAALIPLGLVSVPVAMFVGYCYDSAEIGLDEMGLMAMGNLSGRVRSDADFVVIPVLTGCCC